MTSPTGTVRRLQYPYNRNEDLESETPNEQINFIDLSDWVTNDSDERVDIVLNLSLNEYVALATAIDVGRDLAYGDNSIYIWWIWTRALFSMDICDSVLNCIQNDTDVQDAIINLAFETESQSLIDNAQNQSGLVLGDGNNPTCDLDMLWGGISELIDRAEQLNQDALEIFEVATNQSELISNIFPNTFEDGTSFINAMLDWLQWMQNNIIENYNAQITQLYLDGLKCDLFCLAKDNCELTPEMIVDYFYDRVSSGLTFQSLFEDTVDFLITGSWSGDQIADVFFLSQFAFRAQTGGWLDFIGFASIDRDMRIGFTNASNEWSVLCTDCGWESTLDFVNNDLTSIITFIDCNGSPSGQWTSGTGLVATHNSGVGCSFGTDPVVLRADIDFDNTIVESVQWIGSMTRGGYSDTNFLCTRFSVNDGATRYPSALDEEQASQYTQGVLVPIDVTKSNLSLDPVNRLEFVMRPSNDSGNGSCVLESITLTGTGTKPSQLP